MLEEPRVFRSSLQLRFVFIGVLKLIAVAIGNLAEQAAIEMAVLEVAAGANSRAVGRIDSVFIHGPLDGKV